MTIAFLHTNITIDSWLSKEVGHDTITCAIYLYCDFHTFPYYVSGELNVIDSGTVTLVMTILVKS